MKGQGIVKIQVVGLGYGDESTLSQQVREILEKESEIWLRTEQHSVVSWLRKKGIKFHTFDRIYEQTSHFDAVYPQITRSLFQQARSTKTTVVYAVPGHPMVAERTVQLLLEEKEQQGVPVEIVGGTSFLEGAFTRLEIDPIEGFALLDGTDLDRKKVNPYVHLFVGQVYSRLVASDVKLTLLEIFPPETTVKIVTGLGMAEIEKITSLPLYQLDHRDLFTDFTFLYLSPIEDPLMVPSQFETLVDLFECLRGPDGCPWDRKQTHQSLRPYLIEETYEFLDAIAKNDTEAMVEELGDVLLQVMLHAQIAREDDRFDIYEVIEQLTKKMIRRHPHVFGDHHAETASEVKKTWEEIKKEEKEVENSQESLLAGIPQGLPGISLAYQLQKKASKIGFDWDHKEEVAAKMTEELLELFQAKTKEEIHEEAGDLLFVVVNLVRFFQAEPETALLDACYKFQRRFEFLERRAAEQGKDLNDLSLEQLDKWWEEAKKHLKK